MPMSPEAKAQLSKSIRMLRDKVLEGLHQSLSKTYLLGLPLEKAKLNAETRRRRQRLEQWISEHVGPVPENDTAKKKAEREAAEKRYLLEVEKEAAYTLLNRLIFLRLLEEAGLIQVPVVTGGWESKGYREFREYAKALCTDASLGYGYLLQLVFEEWASEMSGLFGDVGLTSLVPVPPEILRAVVEELDRKELESCWTDDMTLGWVYQYWNDPEREALDAKINAGGKIAPHEIASKTQMFTERYMVEWLLQNSLGQTWLAICKKNGWTASVVVDGTLDKLEARRIEWREKRDKGEVELTDLMPIHGEQEDFWKYWVKQEMPEDAPGYAPNSLKELKLIDPACGSGHFLVVALDMLFHFYQEEAKHRGADWSDFFIVDSIVNNNLHGIDIDPRAVQIAAAALSLKARKLANISILGKVNLVATQFRIGALPEDDPAILELKSEVKKATGVPETLTQTIIDALAQVDYLGSLLQVDTAVVEAIREQESKGLVKTEEYQGDLFKEAPKPQIKINFEAAKKSIHKQLEAFLRRRTSGRDLGLRLRGKQLEAGLRFVRMAQTGQYDLVVGNPPYQGTSRLSDTNYIKAVYPRGKADLYAVFLERGLQLAKKGGSSSLLTMRNWMFIKQYSEIRQWLLEQNDLRNLGDFAVGAFDEVPNDVLSVVVSTFRKLKTPEDKTSLSSAAQPTPPDDRSYDRQRTARKRSAVLAHVGRYDFDPKALKVVPEWPLVYWWTDELLHQYRDCQKLQSTAPALFGLTTGDNSRFLKHAHETHFSKIFFSRSESEIQPSLVKQWTPYVSGAKGRKWLEDVREIINWQYSGLQFRVFSQSSVGANLRNEEQQFQIGIAFSMIGNDFRARAHRFKSIFGNKGSSAFSQERAKTLCLMNSKLARFILESLNPGVGFEVGDVNRLPILSIANSNEILTQIETVFTDHESHREPSVEFEAPGASAWIYAQDWAQRSVDRPEGQPLPPYEPVYDVEPATDHLSYALGVALGRFGASGEGILDPEKDDLSKALPYGILFLNKANDKDSLQAPEAKIITENWKEKQSEIDTTLELKRYLREKFFSDVHKGMYENRPIHWPLSSAKKSFVAWINIHRWTADTLRLLLADHLLPALKSLDSEIDDLNTARKDADKKVAKAAEKRYFKVRDWREELNQFILDVQQCAEKGPLPVDNKCLPREEKGDVVYDPDLDDGVMINSAALWKLLHPQWKDPKKWWKELANCKGKKDYDWSHLAKRYFPSRVDDKCKVDPSLGVAHGCFWKYHPQWAYRWELRLQDDLGIDFTIDEENSDCDREQFQINSPKLACEEIEKEVKRRLRKDKERSPVIEIPKGILWKHQPKLVVAMEFLIQDKYPDFILKEPGHEAASAAYLKDFGADSLAAIDTAYRRRYKKKKKDNPDFHLLRPGLWSVHPELCFQLELKLRSKLSKTFMLHAPDSTEPRKKYCADHPKDAKRWALLALKSKKSGDLFEFGR